MLRPSSFAIHVTYTCPLACAHCCFRSNPENEDRLDLDLVLETIANLDEREIKMVAFTGGEPFLLGAGLVRSVRAAKAKGFVTRIVTSAYFGQRKDYARKRLVELRDAGLDELSISWDDYHEKFVAFECVANVFHEAVALGISTAVNIVQDGNALWTAELVKARLGLGPEDESIVCESPLNRTGRAADDLDDRPLRSVRTLGPCPYVLTGPTLSAKKKLLACCGVIPNTDRLIIDHDYRPENLNTAIQRSLQSPLLNWLYLRGPYAIIEDIGARFGIPTPGKDALGGNCEACKVLFETPDFVAKIDAAVAEKSTEIHGELQVLTALGLASPHDVVRLWAADSTIVEMRPSGVTQENRATSDVTAA